MSRPVRKGLSYFPLDTDIFSDRKIRRLTDAHGAIGLAVYIRLLCGVYKEGYYVKIDDWDGFAADISRDLNPRFVTPKKVRAVIQELVELKLIDTSLVSEDVITAVRIQETYNDVAKKCKMVNRVREHSLLENAPDENAWRSMSENIVNSDETYVNSDKTGINSEFMP